MTRFGSATYVDGVNVFIWELSEALINDGVEVYVISGYNVNKRYVKNLFDIDELPRTVSLCSETCPKSRIREGLLWFCKGSRILNKIAPDMLIINGAVPLYSTAFTVVVNHDLEFRRVQELRYYDMLLYRMFNRIVTTSTELSQGLSRELRLNPSKITIIPICINIKKYCTRGFNQREHAILHIGTRGEKNLEASVNAFEIIAKNDQELKLYIAGPPSNRLKTALSVVKDSNIRRRISYLGIVPKRKLRYLYSTVKVTLVPSLYRVPVISPTVLESIASGTPVIGSSIALSQDLLIHGYNGFRIHPKDFTSLASTTLTLITDHKLWDKMSRNALVLSKFYDAPFIAKKYYELYKKHQFGISNCCSY